MQASISYSDLHDASQQAHKVAKRFDDYADELQSKVLNKIANYNGPWTSNMSDAYDLISGKINELRTDYTRFETYSTDLEDLRDECGDVDEAVKTKIAKLTGDFKDAHGIRNSAIENCLAYTFTAIGNSTAAGRFLGNASDCGQMVRNYIRSDIKVWYNFEGGKEFLKSVLTDALIIVGAVLAVVAAVISGGTLAIVAAALLLGIAIVNVTVDLVHESAALAVNRNPENASMAYRLREIDTYSDLMRNGFILDEHDTTFFNQNYKGRRIVAIAWDGLTLTAKVLNFISSITSLSDFSFDEATQIGMIGGGYSLIGSIIDDGFQISDLLNLDPTGVFSGIYDIATEAIDLVNNNFLDKPIKISLIHKLSSFADLGKQYTPVSIKIPQISIPTIVMPVIQVPHIPVISFEF